MGRPTLDPQTRHRRAIVMDLHIEEYQVRKLLNVHQHVDGPWFWGKDSAHPYVGCR